MIITVQKDDDDKEAYKKQAGKKTLWRQIDKKKIKYGNTVIVKTEPKTKLIAFVSYILVATVHIFLWALIYRTVHHINK
jgi:hypothetical protein